MLPLRSIKSGDLSAMSTRACAMTNRCVAVTAFGLETGRISMRSSKSGRTAREKPPTRLGNTRASGSVSLVSFEIAQVRAAWIDDSGFDLGLDAETLLDAGQSRSDRDILRRLADKFRCRSDDSPHDFIQPLQQIEQRLRWFSRKGSLRIVLQLFRCRVHRLPVAGDDPAHRIYQSPFSASAHPRYGIRP